jgi:hypothetical protein
MGCRASLRGRGSRTRTIPSYRIGGGGVAGDPFGGGSNLLGHLVESLVTLSVRVYAQAAEAQVKQTFRKWGPAPSHGRRARDRTMGVARAA